MKLFCINLAVLCLAPLTIAQNLIVNPSFETGTFSPWSASTAGGGPWAVIDRPLGEAHSGTHYATNGCAGTECIAPDSNANGMWLYQDIPTEVGKSYTLSFYYYSASQATAGPAELQVLWGASATPLTTGGAATCTGNCVYDRAYDSANGSRQFQQIVIPHLIATSTTTRVEFLGRQDPDILGLDDVLVQAENTLPPVPIPSSALLVLVGLISVGLYAGYRRHAHAR